MAENSPVDVFFVVEYVLEPYQADQHLARAERFLFWSAETSPTGQNLLVLANFPAHAYLYEVTALIYDQKLSPPTGAGIFQDEKVWSWRSSGFDLVTPLELRPLISKALGIE